MSTLDVEVLPDSSQPSGGHAIIRLNGVTRLPLFPNFVIRPQDEAISLDDLAGWPKGDRRPLAVRDRAGGIDLYVGPDIVEAPGLVPGTPVVLTIADTELRGELHWPDLPQIRRQSSEQEREEAAPALSVADPAEPPDDELIAEPSIPEDAEPTSKEYSAGAVNGSHVPMPDVRTPSAGERLEPVTAEAEPAPSEVAPPEPLPADGTALPATAATSAFLSIRPASDAGPLRPAQLPSRFAAVARLTVFGLAMLALGALMVALWPALKGITSKASVAGQFGTVVDTLFPDSPLSPAGTNPAGVSRDAALERANAFLHGVGRPADRQEAQFWLRRAVAQDLSDPRVRWALTQLGSVYAAPGPGRQPDYDAAALLWQLAGANGDAVAHCFLGQMFHRGLGVPADRAKARRHYERARALGGCDGLEAATAALQGD